MISCPNRNSADWKALTDAIGEFEAMRDFMEYETIRSIEEVRESKPELFTNSPIKQTVIKPGVEELFESNPELANSVYEALGFNNLRKEYSNVIIDQVWKRLASEGITNADSLIGTRETINNKDFNKFWSAVKDVDIQNVINFFESEKQKALDSYSKYKGEFDPTTGTFTSNDTSFFDNKIKDLNTLLQQKQQAQQLYSQYLDTIFPDSKVKDIVYHGSDSKKEKFSITGAGTHFGTLKAAKERRNKTIIPVVLNIDNPVLFKDILADDVLKAADKFLKENGEYLENGYRNEESGLLVYLYNQGKIDSDTLWDTLYSSRNTMLQILQNALNSNGYRYINEVEDKGSTSYVVFEPEQIHILGSKQDIEGFKDFVENPTSNEKVSFYHGVTTAESFALDKSNTFSTEEQQVTRGNEIINKLIDRLTQNTGIKPVLLSQEDAYAMMREAGKAYNGQPGFFYNGIVYLVIDNLNTEIVFHEFAHPIVRAISNENPALFAKLYNELISTPEGIKIVEQLRKDNDLVEGTVAFMEEAIVMSLGVKADNLTSVAQESNLFSKVINSILYAIKQFLRKLFKGEKLRVENLSATTTLDQLADMLANKQFQIETEVVTNTDVAFYSNAYRQQIIDDLSSIEQKEINMLSKKFYDLAKTQNAFLYTKNYKEIRQVLKDQMERSDLSEILLSLKMFQTEGLKAFSSEEEEKKYMLAHAEGLLNSLLRFNVASKRIYDHFKEINRVLNSDDVKDRLDSQAALAKAFYLNRVIKDWNKFIVEAKEQLKENTDFKSGHPLFNLINEISDNIENSKKYTDKIYTTGVSDMLIDQLTPLAKKIDDHYERIIKRYEERGASQNVIDLYKKEYEIVRLTPDKIKQYLKGELGDVNSALNVYLEGFMHSQDPVILGFSSYVKNRFVEMSAIIQNNYNKFINDIEDLVKSAGYTTAYSRMHMGKDLLFLDTVEKDESGMATKTVYRYITPYKNFKADLKALEDKLEKAKENLNSSDSPERKLEYVNALADLSNFRERYMQREYTSVYYEADRLFADEVGREAYKRREDILSKIRGLNSNVTSPEEILENAETAKIYWREYKQLRSLYYPDGSPKPEDSLDYKVAVRLKEHYELRKKFRKWTPRKGAFENAYLAFIQSLEDAKIKKDSEEYIKKVNEWLKNNTVVKLNDAFYKEQSDIFTELALLAKDDPNQKRIVEIHKEINDIISSYKDENRHPIGNEMPEPLLQKIKALEEEFESLKKTSEEELPGSLTRDQWDFYTKYQEMVRNYGLGIGNAPTPQNTETYMAIRNKLSKDGKLSDDDLEIITKRKALFARLNNLRKRVPTQNFIDTVNDFITSNPKTLKYIKKNLNQSQFSPSDIDRLYDPVHLPFLLSQSPEFAKWFRENHITKEYKKSDGDILVVHTPTRAWTYIDPKNKKYYEKTIITDENGNAIDSIPGVPNLNYWYSEVKDSYTDENGNEIKLKTERLNMLDAIRQGKDITEATVDMHGQWLPRFDAEDKTYINEKYENLKANSKAKFDLAMALLKKHLEFQEELPYNSRLDTEYPRYRKTQYEVISSRSIDDNIKENPVSQFFKNFKSFFAKSVDDVEDGFNTEERELFVKGDLFDDEFGRIPITGMYNLESDLVSMDMLTSMSRYMQSGVRQKTLLDMMPTARALQKLVSIPPYELKEDVTMVGKKLNWVNRVAASVMSPASGKGSNIRSEVINAFIEREFEGKLMSGYGQNNTFLNKFSNGLLSMSSKMFFAFNIPAALKNSFGARFQSMIEASGGEYFNWADYGRGTVWSNMVTAEISMQIYRFGEKSVNYQLVELMDPSQGRLKSKISEGAGISKSVASDVIDLSFMTNVRKWTELNSTLSVFGAMLTKELVEVKDSKGNVSKIKYSDAWEVKDGVIQLKEGVDPTYAPGGKNYTAFVKKVHGVVNRLNGAYDEFNQPLANRFLLYRMIMFLKKYFVEMFMNRWQVRYRNGRLVPRYDGNLDTIAMGYYVQFFRAAARMFSVYKFNVKNMTEDEIIASKKTLTEMGLLAIISQLLISVIFGYDPDDEERYEKLRKKSGALPLPFVVEDPDNPFKGIGWFENHLLNLAIQVESENDSWLPWFGMGFDDYMGIIKMESVATSATLERWIDLFTRFSDYIDYLVTGDTSALYKRAVGPYSWQQEGSAKVLNPLMQTLSITGKVTQPIDAIKSLESRERR